jgi:hypothetical protein
MGATLLLLATLAGDPGALVSGYFRAPAPAQEELLALPEPDAAGNYPIALATDELEALYAHTHRPGLLYEIARRHQAAGNHADAEAYFRAFLARAPALDAFRDAAFNAVVEYAATREAEAAEALRARARATIPPALAALLEALRFL